METRLSRAATLMAPEAAHARPSHKKKRMPHTLTARLDGTPAPRAVAARRGTSLAIAHCLKGYSSWGNLCNGVAMCRWGDAARLVGVGAPEVRSGDTQRVEGECATHRAPPIQQ
eukprot:6188801-Pleurochrysis_carterae.AAC.1